MINIAAPTKQDYQDMTDFFARPASRDDMPMLMSVLKQLYPLAETVAPDTYPCGCNICGGSKFHGGYADLVVADYTLLLADDKERSLIRDLIMREQDVSLSRYEGWHEFLCYKCAFYAEAEGAITAKLYRKYKGIFLLLDTVRKKQ